MKSLFYIVFGFLCATYPMALQGQSMLGNSFASQELSQASQWYESGRYLKAQSVIAPYLQSQSFVLAQEAQYLNVLTAIALDQQDTMELVAAFVAKYPSSLAAYKIYTKVAFTYFKLGQYRKALPWFQKINKDALGKEDLESYYFSYGYTRFAIKDYKGAAPLLEKVLDTKAYGDLAKYYKGYMAYATGDNQQAKALLQAQKGTVNTEKVPYYMANIAFKEGRFNAAISSALDYLPRAQKKEISEVNKIIGESYFNLKAYAKAIPYLLAYRGQRRVWSHEDYYQLGYSYYALKEPAKAIEQFNKIVRGKGALAQNAYYYLGASYLALNQKQAALNAFKSAASFKDQPNIAKAAYLNYAKLSYEVGNAYQGVGTVLDYFITNYPKDPETKVLKTLLLNAYLQEKNFAAALTLLKELPSLATVKERQEVTMQAAIAAITHENYKEALGYLEAVLALDSNTQWGAQAYFWQAELALRQYAYPQAFEALNALKNKVSLLPERPQTLYAYQLGYAHFKTKAYQAAIKAFNDFIAKVSKNQGYVPEYHQALVRTADAYYSLGQFKKAIAFYDKTIAQSTLLKAYATFNSAMSYGLLGELDQKIKVLENFFTQSQYKAFLPKAYMELGAAYATKENPQQAIDYYNRLVSTFPNSALVPEALLKKGLLLFNISKDNDALAVFKLLVKKYPNTPAYGQAIDAAKRIYLAQGNAGAYIKWAKDLNVVPESMVSLEQESYQQILRQAPNTNSEELIALYERYLVDFPQGAHQGAIRFSLAKAYRSAAKDNSAFKQYQWLATTNSQYTETALAAMAEIQMAKDIGGNAIPTLERLLALAQDPQNKVYAMTNLMRLNYEQKNLEPAITYAKQVLNLEGVDKAIELDAQIMLARTAQEQGKQTQAIAAYTALKDKVSGALGAETLYWLAYYKNAAQSYEASNELVQELAQDYANYKNWAAKGLLLMADNFYALEDFFQAHYIWQTLTENFGQFPAVVNEAQERIEQMENAKLISQNNE